MKYLRSLKRAWNGKQLTEKDYNNLSDLMLVSTAWILLWIIF